MTSIVSKIPVIAEGLAGPLTAHFFGRQIEARIPGTNGERLKARVAVITLRARRRWGWCRNSRVLTCLVITAAVLRIVVSFGITFGVVRVGAVRSISGV